MGQRPCALSDELIAHIEEAIQSIRYGSVQITVHDSRVVQIEKSEKIRFHEKADLTPGGMVRDSSRADRTPGGSQTEDGR